MAKKPELVEEGKSAKAMDTGIKVVKADKEKKQYMGTYGQHMFRATVVKSFDKKEKPVVYVEYNVQGVSTVFVSLRVKKNGIVESMNHHHSCYPESAKAYEIACFIHKQYVAPKTDVSIYKNDVDEYIEETALGL